MIILFEENEKSFSTLGLGVLKDATSCIVREKLNDEFSLSMEYPVKGSNFSKIKNNRIICVKPNPYSEPQAFRIYNVTKAINGRVIVDADHISYDMNSIPVKAFSATSLQDVLVQIQNGCIVDNPFTLSSDISRSKSYKTTAPYNLRAILMSDEESIVTEYDAELEFDNYVIKILAKRGKNRGAIVRYGHNMTDINHSLSTDLLYNGVFPYYHTEKTSTETTTADEFPQVYIVSSKTYQDGWLSYSKDGEPYHPMDESPVQIATEGEYYQKVFTWNTLYNVYQERVYNEQVTIIQGLTEPSWLTIDWSKFPLIVIKAAQKGYYKKATDTDWGEIKGVGDIIFEGSITSSGLMENLIISYSEVIPSKSTSTNEEVTEVVDVQLDQPIIWVETNDAKAMLHDRILMLDLTSEFEEEPSQINLRAKAEEYINKHKIGTVKHSTTLSFVDLSATAEGSRFENLDHVELGDTVKVIYEDANIEVELRVITTEYDVLSGRYNSVELGEKKDKMSNSTIQNGDNVSALTNDVGYATVTTVNKLIANIITANYIEALNAKLSSAQISQLSVERINCTGIIEASQFTIDSLVAKLLIAENAEIADTLTAGNIKVAGDISVNSGQITITSENGTSFVVDRDGNLTANSVNITGGNLNINDGVFEVTNDGVLTALAADITGSIRAKEGEIASFVIAEKQLHYGDLGENSSVVVSPGIEGTISNLDSTSKYWAFTASNKFGVTTSGVLYAKDAILSGTITATAGYIANFKIKETSIVTHVGGIDYGWNVSGDGIYLGANGLKLGDGFKVGTDGKLVLTKGSLEIQNGMYTEISLTPQTYVANTYYTKDIYGDYNLATGSYDSTATYYQYDGTKKYFGVDSLGNLSANSVKIKGGELSIGQEYGSPVFNVDQTGKLTAKSAFISGGSINVSKGEILLGGSYEYIYTQINFGSGSGHYTYTYLTSSTYEPNTYYTYNASTQQYNLATGSFDPNVSYYRYWEDAYEPNVYYTLENGVYVLSTSQTYDSSKTYYKYDGGASFYVRHDGSVEARDLTINGGSIRIYGYYSDDASFEVTNEGALTATNATITGSINATTGKIGTATNYFDIGGNDISNTAYIKSGVTSFSDDQHDGVYIGTDGIRLGTKFSVDRQGNVSTTSIKWITNTYVRYAKGSGSNPDTQPPSTGWVTSISLISPPMEPGEYLWTRTETQYSSGNPDYAYSVTRYGEDGQNGNGILTGHGTPSSSLGENGDSYIDLDSMFYYVKSNGSWTPISSIEGSSLLTGTTDPTSSTVANDGDSYINTNTGDYFKKVNGLWVPQGNIKGPPGTPGTKVINGSGAPSSSIGSNGDTYIDHDTWNVYVKVNGSWTPQGSIQGSDADVTWTNILGAFQVAGNTAKGIIYGQNADGNPALLINADAGNIAGWTIFKGYLGYASGSGKNVGSAGTCYISTVGLSGTVAGHTVSSSETDVNKKWGLTLGSNFGVTLNGEIYATSAHLSGEITATSGSIGGLNVHSDYIGAYVDPASPYSSSGVTIQSSGNMYASKIYIREAINYDGDAMLYNTPVVAPYDNNGNVNPSGYGSDTTNINVRSNLGLYADTSSGTVVNRFGILKETSKQGSPSNYTKGLVSMSDILGIVPTSVHDGPLMLLPVYRQYNGRDQSGFRTYTYDAGWVFSSISCVWATLVNESIDSTFTQTAQSLHIKWSGTVVTVKWNNHESCRLGVSILILGTSKKSSSN